jgi:hypothetical protein
MTEAVLTLLLLFLTAFALTFYFWRCLQRSNLPPGPWGYPLVGVLPRFDFSNIDTYRQLRKQYGDIFSLRLGLQNVVVVCGPEMLREVFVVNSEASSDRPQNYLMKELAENAGGFQHLFHF